MRYHNQIQQQREQVRFQSNERATQAPAASRKATCMWCRFEYVPTDGFGVFCSRTCAMQEARS